MRNRLVDRSLVEFRRWWILDADHERLELVETKDGLKKALEIAYRCGYEKGWDDSRTNP